ncbi:MAG: efflux RND transporter periplasmic adaptor subunit [Alphaproteobacteria bacterium]|nr:efflux RND transporter periplasmic adaptor subunit [Alphaproteobacteria bacterium]
MSSSMKSALRFLFLSILLALTAIGGWKITSSGTQTPPLITEKVSRGDLEESVLANGTLQASKLVSVGAQASGQIKILHVQLGDQVKKDQLVAEIDSRTQQNDLLNAQASLENARAAYAAQQAVVKKTEAIYKRQKTMQKRDAVSKESFQDAEAAYDAAKADLTALGAKIKAAEITVDTAKVNLNYTKIYAPIDGTVVAIVAEEGQTVNAAQTTPTIIKVAQLDTMTVEAEISEADVTRVHVGQHVYFTVLGEPHKTYEASLRAVEPAPDSIETSDSSSSSASSSSSDEAIYYNGLFDVPNPDRTLRIAMTAEVHIVLKEAKNALTIPCTALSDPLPDGRYTVRVLNADGSLETRTVSIGVNDNVRAEVTEGLSEGDTIVVSQSASADGESTTASFRRRGPPMGM